MEVEGVFTIFMFVSDFPKSFAYYRTLLGKEPSRHMPELAASFDIGGVNLLLHSDANATWLPPGAKKGVGSALHFRVNDIDAYWEQLNRQGIPLPEKPVTLHTGIRKFALKDPDGYEIELVQPPN